MSAISLKLGQIRHVRKLIRSGSSIGAMKYVRNAASVSLKEAKDFVEWQRDVVMRKDLY